jgi:hypothetical protein
MDSVDHAKPGADTTVILAHAPMPGSEVATDAQSTYQAILEDGDIVSDSDYVARAQRLAKIKGKEGTLTGKRDDLLAPFKAGIEGIREFFRGPLDWLDKAARLEKERMIAYDKIQDEARKRAQEEAFRLAEAERKRLEKLANKATARGDIDKAVALEGQALTTVAPIIERGTPKVTGAVYRDVWAFQIEDEAKIPRQFLKVDEQKIRRQVNATRAETRIDGVRVYKDKQLAIRGS